MCSGTTGVMAVRFLQVKRLEELPSQYSRFFWRAHRLIDVYFGAGGTDIFSGGDVFFWVGAGSPCPAPPCINETGGFITPQARQSGDVEPCLGGR